MSATGRFDYSVLPDTGRSLLTITADIRHQARSTVENCAAVGRKLLEARGQLSLPLFRSWLAAEFQWSDRMAYHLINVAQRAEALEGINASNRVLFLLASPSTPIEAIEEVRQVAGPVSSAQAREAVNRRREQAPNRRGPGRGRQIRRSSSGPQPSVDALGQTIPGNLRDVFNDATLASLDQQLGQIEQTVRSVSPWARYLRLEDALGNLHQARECLTAAIPYAVHQACRGAGCGACRQTGYLTRWRHEEIA